MQRWEYTTEDFTKPRKGLEDLNRVGADGWGLMALPTGDLRTHDGIGAR